MRHVCRICEDWMASDDHEHSCHLRTTTAGPHSTCSPAGSCPWRPSSEGAPAARPAAYTRWQDLHPGARWHPLAALQQVRTVVLQGADVDRRAARPGIPSDTDRRVAFGAHFTHQRDSRVGYTIGELVNAFPGRPPLPRSCPNAVLGHLVPRGAGRGRAPQSSRPAAGL